MIDVNALIGGYPFRHVPHPEPAILAQVARREGFAQVWTGHLPTAFHRDPGPGNAELYAALAPHADMLRPVPVVRPDWPGATRALDEAVERGAPAVRAYPQHWGLPAGSQAMLELAAACASRGLTLLLTVRFEDVRQRHALDVAGDLSAAHVRELARGGSGARLLVCAAGREFVEEVHWGLTPAERARMYWDISWLWGPPADELSHLFRTVGADRFCLGTQWPLRLVQAPVAALELREDDVVSLPMADPASWCR